MNLETPIEYFHGEIKRWSFGFENPNMAAVIFACAMPLLWGLWQMAWRLENRWLKITAVLTTACMLIGAWYCLNMTFSRGGLVAASVALLYLIGNSIRNKHHPETIWYKQVSFRFSVMLLVILGAVTVSSGLADRSVEAFGNDASVGNRFDLWSGALQMSVENVHGFGAGNSGKQYMHWYQPLERHEGYRTMVNSYLTFLVERGWFKSCVILLIFAIFWVWTTPRNHELAMITFRGSIIAFLIAGVFSTTMEEWRLWILPVSCGFALSAISVRNKNYIEKKLLIPYGIALPTIIAVLYISGLLRSISDPLRREFGMGHHQETLNCIGPKNPRVGSIGCLVDEAVTGDQDARLIREMALRSGARIYLGSRIQEADRILCMGKNVRFHNDYPGKSLVLLAPDKLPIEDLAALTSRRGAVQVIIPEIDEDGRAEFWDLALNNASGGGFKKTTLVGVGNRVDWAWSEVIEIMKGP